MSGAKHEDFEGRFWLPEDRHRAYGRVTYDAVEGVLVHFADTNFGPSLRDENGFLPIVYGETLGGTPVTLQGVGVTRRHEYGLGPQAGDSADAFATRLLYGAHDPDPANVALTFASTSFFGLDTLLLGGAIDFGPMRPTEDSRAESWAVELGEGVRLTLVASHLTDIHRGLPRPKRTTHAQWEFAEPIRLADARRRYFSVLRDLIAFSTRAYSAVSSLNIEGGPHSRVTVLERPYPRVPSQAEREVYALTWNFGEFFPPEKHIAEWFALRERVGPVWNLYFAAADRSEALLEDRLLGLLSFAEGYHRAIHDVRPISRARERAALAAVKAALTEDDEARALVATTLAHFNQQSQRTRLRYLLERAHEPLEDWWYVEYDVFLDRLIHTRNWLVHWGKRQRRVVESGNEMLILVRGLIVMMYVNVLYDLGLDEVSVRKVIGSGWRLESAPDIWELDDDDVVTTEPERYSSSLTSKRRPASSQSPTERH